MGFFRHSSASAPTDTIPASTTLSARLRLSRRQSLITASVLTCAGVFGVTAVNAGSGPSAPASSARQATHSSTVQLNVDQQNSGTSVTPAAPAAKSTQSQATTSINAFSSGDGAASTTVTVNGQPVDIPSNGSVSKTVVNNSGETSLEVNSSSQGSSSNNTFTSLNVNVSSNTATSSDSSP